MDPFHEQLARVALDAAGSFGFALAGGYAVQAHGFLNRMSSDVDLFAEASGEFDFPEAVSAVIKAYQREGLQVQAEVLTASFARLDVRSASDNAKVDSAWSSPVDIDLLMIGRPDRYDLQDAGWGRGRARFSAARQPG